MTEPNPLQRKAPAPGKRIALFLAIAVHVLLAAFLIYGVHWQTKAPAAVEVELVRAVPEPPAASPAPSPEPEPPPKPEPKVEPKPEPKPLPPPPKPDIAIKDPKPKPEKTPPKEAPKEVPKEKAKEPPRPDPFQEQLKRESEKLDQRKAAESAARELDAAQATQAAAARMKALGEWLAALRGKIRGNIVLPPEIKGNPEAVFDVNLLPGGEVLTVKLKRSSGLKSLDEAIERAILKSSPLPKPKQDEIFSRSLELKFRPLED